MSKIEGLKSVRENITLFRGGLLRAILNGEKNERDELLYRVGVYSLLLEEIKDHLRNLTGIITACRHGLADTSPIGFDPWADGECMDPRQYDPYEDIAECMEARCSVSVLTLSPALMAYIEQLPERTRAGRAKFLDFFGKATWEPDPTTGKLRALTEEETGRWPEESMLKIVERTFFSLTYAQDMAAVQTLAAARYGLQQIIDLTL